MNTFTPIRRRSPGRPRYLVPPALEHEHTLVRIATAPSERGIGFDIRFGCRDPRCGFTMVAWAFNTIPVGES
jgi:hypothetical protein